MTLYDVSTNSYRVPEIKEHQLKSDFYDMHHPMVVNDRSYINMSETILNNVEDTSKTYCFISKNIEFPPFVSKGDKIFINPTANVIEGLFAISSGTILSIVMAKKDEDGLAYFNNNDEKIIVTNDKKIIPILMTVSEGYR